MQRGGRDGKVQNSPIGRGSVVRRRSAIAAAFGKIGEAYAAQVHRFAKQNGIPVRYFAKGEKKEEIARPLIEAVAAGAPAGWR